jgi:hypothetical protein
MEEDREVKGQIVSSNQDGGRHCRFYPLVRELQKGGWPGAMIMVGPTQVEKFLDKHEEKYFWYQMEVNLLDHFLIGPFDFMRDPMWTIPDKVSMEHISGERSRHGD